MLMDNKFQLLGSPNVLLMQWETAGKVCKDGQNVKGTFHTGRAVL